MAQLPLITDPQMMQQRWKSLLDPVLAQPILDQNILKNVLLASGTNVVNHKLGRKLQGWIVVRMHNSFAQVYDLQDSNTMSDATLVLNASAPVLLDLIVF